MGTSEIAFFVNLFILAAAGSGPALWLLAPELGRRRALALAPALGLAVAACAVSGLTSLGGPIASWAFGLSLGLVLTGLLSAGLHLRLGKATAQDLSNGELAAAAGIALAVGMLLAACLELGGFAGCVVRANPHDAFNYAALAESLRGLPWAAFFQRDPASLLDAHAYHALMPMLRSDRVATGALLGWACQNSGARTCLFTYGFGLMGLALLFPAAWLAAWRLGLPRWAALALALALSLGFWPQQIIDAGAMAHALTLSLGLLLALAAAEPPRASRSGQLRHALLLALAAGALLSLYSELSAFLAVGILAWRALGPWKRRQGEAETLGLTLALMLLLWLPALRLYASFLARQTVAVVAQAWPWVGSSYAWLFKKSEPWRLVSGYWGLYLDAEWSSLLRWPTLVLAAGLSLLAAKAALDGLKQRKATLGSLVTALALAALMLFAIMIGMGRWWAAGKAMGYGALYAPLALSAWAWAPRAARPRWAKALLWAFLLLQISFWPLRLARLACCNGFPAPYPSPSAELSAQLKDPASLEPALQAAGGPIAVDISSDWMAECFDLYYSKLPLVRARDLTCQHGQPSGLFMRTTLCPQALVLEPALYAPASLRGLGPALASTGGLAVYRPSPLGMDQLAFPGSLLKPWRCWAKDTLGAGPQGLSDTARQSEVELCWISGGARRATLRFTLRALEPLGPRLSASLQDGPALSRGPLPAGQAWSGSLALPAAAGTRKALFELPPGNGGTGPDLARFERLELDAQ